MKWLRQFRSWIQTRGTGSLVAINILFLTFSYFISAQIHTLGFHFKWFKTKGSFTGDDIAVAVITGVLLGRSQISYREKSQRARDQQGV
jgi:hypothetical protein